MKCGSLYHSLTHLHSVPKHSPWGKLRGIFPELFQISFLLGLVCRSPQLQKLPVGLTRASWGPSKALACSRPTITNSTAPLVPTQEWAVVARPQVGWEQCLLSAVQRSWGDTCQAHTCFAPIPSVTVNHGQQITQSCISQLLTSASGCSCEVHSQPCTDLQNPSMFLRETVPQGIKLLWCSLNLIEKHPCYLHALCLDKQRLHFNPQISLTKQNVNMTCKRVVPTDARLSC